MMKLNFTILEEENNKRTYTVTFTETNRNIADMLKLMLSSDIDAKNEMCKNIGVELVKGIDSALDVHIERMLHE